MLIFYYITILTSIIGYGIFINEKFVKYETNNLGSIGLIGIFSLLLISYSTSQFIPHTEYFNFTVLLLGIFSFIYFLIKKKLKL